MNKKEMVVGIRGTSIWSRYSR